MHKSFATLLALAVVAGLTLLGTRTAAAQQVGEVSATYDIGPGPLEPALRRLAEDRNLQILFAPEDVRGLTTPGAKGRLTPREAIEQLLRGTALTVTTNGNGAYAIKPVATRRPDEPVSMGSITVTAQKREERLMDVPLSVSAYTNRMMQDSGAKDLADVVSASPGTSIVDNQVGYNNIAIRGVNSTFGAAVVGYYLDELPFTLLSNTYTPDVRTYDLERVEVLRGPQGTLYGDGSLGGVVRILTKDPDLYALRGSADLIGSDTRDGKASGSEKAMVNIPIAQGVAALRLVATKEDLGGWIDNSQTGVKDVNDRHLENYRAKLAFAPGRDFDVVFSAWKVREDALGNALSLPDRTTTNGPSTRTADYDQYSGTIRYRGPLFDVLSATSKIKYADSLQETFFGSPLTLGVNSDVVTEELRLTSNTAGSIKWTGGLFYRKIDQTNLTLFPAFGLNAVGRGTSKSYAVFGEGTWTGFDNKVDAILGLRFFRDEREDETAADPATLAQVLAIDPTFDPHPTPVFRSTSPRFNLTYHLTSDWLVYTNIAKGFRSGQVQSASSLLLGAQHGITLPNGVDPETLWSYEIGTKRSLADDRVQVEASIYYNDWRNIQTNRTIDPQSGLQGLLNGGKARTVGIEAAASLSPFKGLVIRLSGSHLKAEYLEDVPDINIQKGQRIGAVPETNLSANATYRWPMNDSLTGFAYGAVRYTSNMVDIINSTIPSDAITIADLRGGVEAKNWAAYLFVENLFDANRATDVGFAGNNGAVLRTRPRTIGLNLRATF